MIDASLRDRRIAIGNQLASARGQLARLEAECAAAFDAFKEVEVDYLRAKRVHSRAATDVADKRDAVLTLQSDLQCIDRDIEVEIRKQVRV